MMRRQPRRPVVLATTALVAIAGGAIFALVSNPSERHAAPLTRVDAGETVSVSPQAARLPRVEPGSRQLLAELSLRAGKLRLERARMSDGSECLLHAEVERGVTGSQCFDNGLFGSSRVAFTVNSEGGPERFTGMYLVGVAHPSAERIELVSSGADTTAVDLAADDVFFVESSPSELELGVFPAALRVYGRGGRLLETVEIPAPR